MIALPTPRNGRSFVTAIRSTVLSSLAALLLVLGGALQSGHTAGSAGSTGPDKFDRAVEEGIRTGEQSFRLLVRTRPGAIDRVLARLDGRQSARVVSPVSQLLAVSATRPALATPFSVNEPY